MELRFNEVEVRALGANKIGGMASVTYDGQQGSEYELMPGIFERIAPGAFDSVIGNDVVGTWNHDYNIILGRTPHTMKLWADQRGLHYEIDLPDTQAARDLFKLVERGDVRGSSFGAILGFTEWTKEGNKDIRTVKKIKRLLDVGPVSHPAYGSTSAALRSEQAEVILREREQWYKNLETQIRIEKAKTLLDSLGS